MVTPRGKRGFGDEPTEEMPKQEKKQRDQPKVQAAEGFEYRPRNPKAEVPPKGKTAPKHVLAQLVDEANAHALNYQNQIMKLRIDPMEKRKQLMMSQAKNQLTGLHKAYASMMVLSCVAPLAEGFNPATVMTSATMGATMWMLSPEFRKQAGNYVSNARMALMDLNDRRINQKRSKEMDKIDKAQMFYAARGKDLPYSWEKRIKNIQVEGSHGRVPFNEHSAALTKLGLMRKQFVDDRSAKRDLSPEEFEDYQQRSKETYETVMGDLHDDFKNQGINIDVVNNLTLSLATQYMREDPTIACMFKETAHADLGFEDDTMTLYDRNGAKIVGGMLQYRPVEDEATHEYKLSESIYHDMLKAARNTDIDGLQRTIQLYGVAGSVYKRDVDINKLNLGDNERGAFNRVCAAMDSMMFDGLSQRKMENVYADAYIDAMRALGMDYPDVEKAWAQSYGDNWQDTMHDIAKDPKGVYEYFKTTGATPSANSPVSEDVARAREQRAARLWRQARMNQAHGEEQDTIFSGFASDIIEEEEDGPEPPEPSIG